MDTGDASDMTLATAGRSARRSETLAASPAAPQPATATAPA